MRVTSAASMATSVPIAPTATPVSAVARPATRNCRTWWETRFCVAEQTQARSQTQSSSPTYRARATLSRVGSARARARSAAGRTPSSAGTRARTFSAWGRSKQRSSQESEVISTNQYLLIHRVNRARALRLHATGIGSGSIKTNIPHTPAWVTQGGIAAGSFHEGRPCLWPGPGSAEMNQRAAPSVPSSSRTHGHKVLGVG